MDKILRIFDSQIKEINEKEKSVVALVSTGAWDRQDEVLLPEGADFKNFRKNPVVMWAHNYDEPPIGRAAWIKTTDEGILAKTIFADTPFANEIFGLYKDGFMNAFSIGFIPKEHMQGDGDKHPRRTYTDWEVIEYSAVPIPANPEALAMAYKKGMISDNIKKCIDSFKIEDDKPEPVVPPKEEVKNINQMEIIEPLKKELEQEKGKVKSLTTEIARLSGELFIARVSLLDMCEKLKSNSGVSGDELIKTINEIFVRETRKAQGRLD